MDVDAILARAEANRSERLKPFMHDRYGMFVTWGLYARLARGEWVMNRECIPHAEYATLADDWQVDPDWAPRLADLALAAGVRYLVLTAKHHEGFCLWDSDQTDFNAARRGPRRDLVREFCDALRARGLKVGLYYSLMDWAHPDGRRCVEDEAARERFLAFTHGCVRELMSRYGEICCLFYDVPWPLTTAEAWDSAALNAMVYDLQPGIVINDRSKMALDYGTPEGEVEALAETAWECCMTFNDNEWGYAARCEDDLASPRDVLRTLNDVVFKGGNLLLNVGPRPDGSVPPELAQRLLAVGRWLEVHGEAVYGTRPVLGQLEIWNSHGFWSLSGNTAYLWNLRSRPRGEVVIGGLLTEPTRVVLMGLQRELQVERRGLQTVISGIPDDWDEPDCATMVLRFEFDRPPRQAIGFAADGTATRPLGGGAAEAAAEANA